MGVSFIIKCKICNYLLVLNVIHKEAEGIPSSRVLGNNEIIFLASHLAILPPAAQPFWLRYSETGSLSYILPISRPKSTPDS